MNMLHLQMTEKFLFSIKNIQTFIGIEWSVLISQMRSRKKGFDLVTEERMIAKRAALLTAIDIRTTQPVDRYNGKGKRRLFFS